MADAARSRDGEISCARRAPVELRPGEPVDEIARLVQAEQACCPFFAFAITVDQRGVGLEVTAPTDALPVVDELFGSMPA